MEAQKQARAAFQGERAALRERIASGDEDAKAELQALRAERKAVVVDGKKPKRVPKRIKQNAQETLQHLSPAERREAARQRVDALREAAAGGDDAAAQALQRLEARRTVLQEKRAERKQARAEPEDQLDAAPDAQVHTRRDAVEAGDVRPPVRPAVRRALQETRSEIPPTLTTAPTADDAEARPLPSPVRKVIRQEVREQVRDTRREAHADRVEDTTTDEAPPERPRPRRQIRLQ